MGRKGPCRARERPGTRIGGVAQGGCFRGRQSREEHPWDETVTAPGNRPGPGIGQDPWVSVSTVRNF